MPIIILPKSLVAHTTAKAADVMADFNKLLELVNGQLDSENLAAAAVATANLADSAVTSRKVKPTGGVKLASGPLAEITTPGGVDIPGCSVEVTPSVASLLFVTATFHYFASEGVQALGFVLLDGVAQGPIARSNAELGHRQAMIGMAIPLTAAPHTVKLRGQCNSALVSMPAGAEPSALSYMLVAS